MVTITTHGSSCPRLEKSLLEDLLNMMLKIKGVENSSNEIPQKQTVAFTAGLTKQITVPDHGIVRFDRVWTNVGNAYDPDTGVFTATVSGVYHFSCTVMNGHKSSVRVYLFKNETPTVSGYIYDVNHHDTGTINANIELKEGDKVSIRRGTHDGKNVYSEDKSNMSMFSGFLIG